MNRVRWHVIVWMAILAIVGARALLTKRADGVYPIFSTAGRNWSAGTTAYSPPSADLDVYRYSPPISAFFEPWGMLPDRVGGVLWRGLNAGIFLIGLAAWWRCRGQMADVSLGMLLVIPLAVGGINNGQCNALDVGMLLLAAAAFSNGRWAMAAACATVPVLFKGYPLAFGLLLCLIEPRRFPPRLAACLLLGAVIPFLVHSPDFVAREYADFFQRLSGDDRTQFDITAGYRDLHMLLRRVGLPLSLTAYRLLEIALGGCAAAIVWWGNRRGWGRAKAVEAGVWLGLCWMTLAGPATESCTYVVISPVLAAAVLIVRERPRWQMGLVWTSFVLFTAAAMSVWFPGLISHPIQATAIQPLAALLLTAFVINETCRSAGTGPNEGHFFSVFGKSASSSRTAA